MILGLEHWHKLLVLPSQQLINAAFKTLGPGVHDSCVIGFHNRVTLLKVKYWSYLCLEWITHERGVWPSSSLTVGSAPFSRRYLTVSTSPLHATWRSVPYNTGDQNRQRLGTANNHKLEVGKYDSETPWQNWFIIKLGHIAIYSYVFCVNLQLYL